MRTALLHPGQTIMTLEAAMGLSRSAMPPLICLEGLGRGWRFTLMTRSARIFVGVGAARASLASRGAGDPPDGVLLLDVDADRLRQFTFCDCHQITSGARDTIFMNFLSRSSRATGPKTRVPTSSPPLWG